MKKEGSRTKAWSRCAACVAVLLVFTVAAEAQDGRATTGSEAPGVEITPFVSLGSESASGVGAAIRYPVAFNVSIESEVGYRPGQLHALGSHVSALYDLPRIGRVTPYLAAGIGLEQYGSAVEQPGGTVLTRRRGALAVNAGGGLTVDATRDWAVRTDARWFNGIGRDASEHWRLYNGVTFRAGRK